MLSFWKKIHLMYKVTLISYICFPHEFVINKKHCMGNLILSFFLFCMGMLTLAIAHTAELSGAGLKAVITGEKSTMLVLLLSFSCALLFFVTAFKESRKRVRRS